MLFQLMTLGRMTFVQTKSVPMTIDQMTFIQMAFVQMTLVQMTLVQMTLVQMTFVPMTFVPALSKLDHLQTKKISCRKWILIFTSLLPSPSVPRTSFYRILSETAGRKTDASGTRCQSCFSIFDICVKQ